MVTLKTWGRGHYFIPVAKKGKVANCPAKIDGRKYKYKTETMHTNGYQNLNKQKSLE